MVKLSLLIIILSRCSDSSGEAPVSGSDPEGVAGTTTSTSPNQTSSSGSIKVLLVGQDLPECKTKNEGETFYIIAEELFKYCSEEQEWTEIDLQGPPGNNGTDGTSVVGATGPAGAAGAAGPAGVFSSAGIFDSNNMLIGYYLEQAVFTDSLQRYEIMTTEGFRVQIQLDDGSIRLESSMADVHCVYENASCTGTCYAYGGGSSKVRGRIIRGDMGMLHSVAWSATTSSITYGSYHSQNLTCTVSSATDDLYTTSNYTGSVANPTAPLYLGVVE
jgi:hypothetical protein